jgi:hypothetical protein
VVVAHDKGRASVLLVAAQRSNPSSPGTRRTNSRFWCSGLMINLIRDVKRLSDLADEPSALENNDLRFQIAVQRRPLTLLI